jgi:hypothetical protein
LVTPRTERHALITDALSEDGRTARQLADATGLKLNRVYLDLRELEGKGRVLREYIEGASYWFIRL